MTEQEGMLDALLGDDDDFYDEAAADEFLNAMGIDPSSLVLEFKTYLEAEGYCLEADADATGERR